MIKVVGVRFRKAGKIYYFDPKDLEMKAGDHVIVETARGVEYGTVMTDPKGVLDDQVVQPLKPVLRLATKEDDKTEAKNREKEKQAYKICQEKIQKHGSSGNDERGGGQQDSENSRRAVGKDALRAGERALKRP